MGAVHVWLMKINYLRGFLLFATQLGNKPPYVMRQKASSANAIILDWSHSAQE